MRDTELIKESVVFLNQGLKHAGIRDESPVWTLQQMTHRQALLAPGSREHVTGSFDHGLDIIQDLSDPLRFFYFLLADAAYEFFRVARDTSVRKQEAVRSESGS